MSHACRLVHDAGIEKPIRVNVIHKGPRLLITVESEEMRPIRRQSKRFPRGRKCSSVALSARL